MVDPVAIDRVMTDIDKNTCEDNPSTTFLKLNFLDRISRSYDIDRMPYAKEIHAGESHRDMFRVNEHLSVLISIVANLLVIAVFVRVLGLARLPSRIIVSLASVNLVVSLSQALHTTSVTVTTISDSADDCRFVSLMVFHCWSLQFNSMSAAIVERILACNLPNYYSRSLHILSPAILITPWAFWTINVILIVSGVYDYDLGYQCSTHLNVIAPHSSIHSSDEASVIMVILVLILLGVTLVLHSQNSGDVWEINRMQFEVRTTAVILRVAAITMFFTGPVVFIVLTLHLMGLTYNSYRYIHMASQLSVHKGMGLITVLLTRQEFRRHLPLVFESTASISRTRTHNMLISHPPERSQSSRMRRLSDMDRSRGTNGDVRQTNAENDASAAARTRHASSVTQSINAQTTQEVNPLIGRDKIISVQTPDWLKKKEPKVQQGWQMPKFLAPWTGQEDSEPTSATSHEMSSYD